jgi:hypothetical protein
LIQQAIEFESNVTTNDWQNVSHKDRMELLRYVLDLTDVRYDCECPCWACGRGQHCLIPPRCTVAPRRA